MVWFHLAEVFSPLPLWLLKGMEEIFYEKSGDWIPEERMAFRYVGNKYFVKHAVNMPVLYARHLCLVAL